MVRLSLALSLSLALGVAAWSPQPSSAAEFGAHAKSGKPSRIRLFFSCFGSKYPGLGDSGAVVEHGAITIKKTEGQRCGSGTPPVPINEIWFTSEPGFKGVAKVIFYNPWLAGAPPVIIDVTVE